MNSNFIEEWTKLASVAHMTSVTNGFWDEFDSFTKGDINYGTPQYNIINQLKTGTELALIHSEISEALDALRNGNPSDDKIPEFSNIEVELADAVIRIMNLSCERRWNVAEAIVKKIQYNKNRPHKHGKEF